MQRSPIGEDEANGSGRRAERVALGTGLCLSIAIHAALLLLVGLPRGDPPPDTLITWDVEQVEVPPVIDIPEAPGEVRRPSPPEVSAVEVDEAVALSGEPTPTVDSLPLPEPPRVTVASPEERSEMAPPEVAPSLEAPDHFRQRLEKSYPRILRDRGLGGIVDLLFFVNPRGDVSRVRVARSSGHGSLDQVAQRLAGQMKFLPALNRDRAVGVWVSQRICFMTVARPDENPTPAECEHRVLLGSR